MAGSVDFGIEGRLSSNSIFSGLQNSAAYCTIASAFHTVWYFRDLLQNPCLLVDSIINIMGRLFLSYFWLGINDLGYKIKIRRHELGMSMDELAARIHSDKSAISRIENGDRAPRYDTFLKIADALQIHPALLCAERDENAEIQFLLSGIEDKISRLSPRARSTALSSIHAMLDGFLLQNNISNT